MKNSEQQRLFTHYNPLEERIGENFFDELPKTPGIYKMYGRSGELLYVGKAKNLRNRLFTYRRAKVGKTSRKTIRLIRMVHRIEFELCEDEKEALLLENKLIRTKRPEFNHAKKSPETYYFVHLKWTDQDLYVELNMRRHAEKNWDTFGAFKGHLIVRKAVGALLRLLYVAEHSVESAHHLPSVLVKNMTPMNYRFPLPGEKQFIAPDMLQELFTGRTDHFFDSIMAYFQELDLLDKYIGKLILEDLEALKRFYKKCCRRNYQIMEQLQLDSTIIPQHKLDDYLIEVALD